MPRPIVSVECGGSASGTWGRYSPVMRTLAAHLIAHALPCQAGEWRQAIGPPLIDRSDAGRSCDFGCELACFPPDSLAELEPDECRHENRSAPIFRRSEEKTSELQSLMGI